MQRTGWNLYCITYHKKVDKSLAKSLNDMVDLHIQLVCSEQGSPSHKDGMCDLEDTNVDLGVRGRESADKFLHQVLMFWRPGSSKEKNQLVSECPIVSRNRNRR